MGAGQVAQGEGLCLQQRGSRMWTCCPFHREKTPSLMFDEHGGWYCFGCNTGGSDGVSFYAAYHRCSQSEAARALLGDDVRTLSPDEKAKVQKRRDATDLRDRLHSWRDERIDELASIIKTANRIMMHHETGQPWDTSWDDEVWTNALTARTHALHEIAQFGEADPEELLVIYKEWRESDEKSA